LRGIAVIEKGACQGQNTQVEVRHGDSLDPNDWRPMPTIGQGVREIRVHGTLEHRVVYIAKFTEAVYVLHAFEKRSRRTPARDAALTRQRFQQLLRQRRRGHA
jgi:phage-related protein